MADVGKRRWSAAIVILGVAIWSGFCWNFILELRTLDVLVAPVVTVLLGSLLSLAVVFGGYRCYRTEWLDGPATRRIFGWALGGMLAVSVVRATTIAIRTVEGRNVGEPQLDVLIGFGAGALAGLAIGGLHERVRHDVEHVRQARDALSFLNRTLRHECLNGLNIVAGQAARLEDDLVEPDRRAQLSSIESRCADMADLIQNVRVYARAFSGDDDFEVVDLSSVLRERVAGIRESFPDATVELDAPDPLPVRANDAIGTVIENLLQNAIEHNDTLAPTVSVRGTIEGQTVTVTITDDGPGIPAEVLADVRENRPEEIGGFGLYLVHDLVHHFDGSISFAESADGGSAVTIELPRAPGGTEIGDR